MTEEELTKGRLRAVDRADGSFVRARTNEDGVLGPPFFVEGDDEASVRRLLTEIFGAEWGEGDRFAVVDASADPTQFMLQVIRGRTIGGCTLYSPKVKN